MIDGPLVSVAVECGFRVSTFDPPGQYRSTRPARVSLDEMLDCATETLGTLRLPARVPVIGHSMSALCAFYLGLAQQRHGHRPLPGDALPLASLEPEPVAHGRLGDPPGVGAREPSDTQEDGPAQ
jgi:surfactin synthase thioesterase subunit